MASAYWGIDVSPTSLKAVKLVGSANNPKLTEVDSVDFAISPFEAGEGQGNIRPEVQDGLFEFASRYNFDNAIISTSLPSHTTFNRFTTLPPVENEDTEKLVRHEAQQQIPFPLDDVIWDYQEIVNEEEGTVEVILFAIKEEIVNEFLSSMKRAGMDPDIIQFSSVALYNFIQYDQAPDRTTAVLDLGANNCDLIIIEGERHWTRDIPVSANDFTRALQQELDVGFDKAEQIKRGAGNSSESEQYLEILKPAYRNLVQEVNRSIGFYKSMSSGSTIEQVYLTGGGARTLQLDEFISDNMDLPVSFVSSLNKIEFSDDLDEEQFNQVTMSIGPAAGLALQGMNATINRMNLVPERVVREKEFQRKKPFVIAAVVLFGLASLLYVFSLRLRYNIFQNRSQKLGQQQQAIADVKNRIKKFNNSSKTDRFRQIGQQVNQSVPNRTLPVLFWNELTKITPNNRKLRNQLNSILLPYLKAAAEDDQLPATYAEFRRMENLSQEWQQVREKALNTEKKFLYILGIEHEQAGGQTIFNVHCGIFQRDSREKGLAFVENKIYKPLLKRFAFKDARNTGVSEERTSNQLTLVEQENPGGGNFQLQNFRIWNVRFAGNTEELKEQMRSSQE